MTKSIKAAAVKVFPMTAVRKIRLVFLSAAMVWWLMPVGAAPVLVVSPATLTAQAQAGNSPGTQQVAVSNAGNGALKWTVTQPASPAWFNVSPTKGVNTGTLTVSFTTSTLAIGSYQSSFKVTTSTSSATVTVSLTITSAPSPPPPSGRGPQAVACPAGATTIAPTQNMVTIVNGAATGTTFCVLAGTQTLTAPVNLKAGQRLIGQQGAIIDGTNVVQGFDAGSTAILRVWNCGIDCSGGLIQNLVIKNLAAYNCVGIVGAGSDNWVIDHNEIYGCAYGTNIGPNNGVQLTNNIIHNNTTAGYGGNAPLTPLMDNNEFYNNGSIQKWLTTTNAIVRDNYFHNEMVGMWFDGDNTGALIENNLFEDVSGEAIFYEVSEYATIRNNTIRRSGSHGIFVSTSNNVESYGNLLEDNFRGIQYFLNCGVIGVQPYPGSLYHDLANNYAHDNTVRVGTGGGAYATLMSHTGTCDITPYLNGSKGLRFDVNHYMVPSLSGAYWLWDAGALTWTQWQAVPQDVMGTVALR